MKCIIIKPPATDVCGAEATHWVRFTDGDRAPACQVCAIYMTQIAQSNGTNVAVEKQQPPTQRG